MVGKPLEKATNVFVVYEDDDLLIVNKPNQLIVHHSSFANNIEEESLVQLLRAEFSGYLSPIHRLDRKTSGLIMFGKSAEITKHYQAEIEQNKVIKKYLALVRGFTSASGQIDTPIRPEGKSAYKEALTLYNTLEQCEADFPVDKYAKARYSLLELSPKTGRTHQLRKHCNKLAHPIIGDPKYGDRHHNHEFERRFGHTFLYLHAFSLEFNSISTKEIVSVKATPPAFWDNDLKKIGFQLDLEGL